jgi:uncharacterized protein (TIGR02147 family)
MLRHDFSQEIYSHSSPATFLKAVYLQRKLANPRFSYRSWAKELGLREATPLSLVLQGRRGLPLRYVPILTKTLPLDQSAQRYLEAIARRAVARAPSEYKSWTKIADQMIRLSRSRPVVIQTFQPFSDPLAMLLLNLVELEDFKMDLEWISKRIRKKATVEQIQATLNQLIAEGYIKPDSDKTLKSSNKHLISTQDVPSASIRKFHELSLLNAISSLHLVDVAEREFGSYFFTAQQSRLPEMKQRIRNFLRAFIAEYSDGSSHHDMVYQINLNLTPKTERLSQAI